MSEFDEYQRRRWTRENAHLYIRHDAYRYLAPGAPFYVGQDVVKYGWPCGESLLSKHDGVPLQQAVAEFDPDYEDELCRLRCDIASLRLDWEITKLAWKARKYNPDQPRVPTGNPDGGQWTSEGAQGTPLRVAGPGVGRSAGSARFPNATPAQQARFAVADARAQDALRRVREIDPNWRPQTGAYGTSIESEILKANDLAAAAQARINELARVGGRRRSSCTRINSGTRNGL